MSSRAVRKALKRLEAEELRRKLSQTDEPEHVEAEEEEEEDVKGPSNPFAMLNEVEASEGEEESVARVESPVIVSKKETTTTQSSSSITTKKSKNKKKKRKPAKENESTTSTPKETSSTPAPELDDVDRAIQEISQKYGDSPSRSESSTAANLSAKYSLLSVQPKFLDAETELRKLFGKIVDMEKRERPSVPGVPSHVLNRLKSTQQQRKRTLMNPKDEWQLFAAYNKRMLSMDIIEKDGAITNFKFVHSRRYQDVQMQFFITALGGDGNVLMGLLRESPFHVDTCIQVSEILKHQGSLSEAADLIERALFSLDCGLHPLFNLTLGTTRLPFVNFENRCFYLAVWHHMESLGRRGCWRTCLEFNKLLFAMEPEENPYAALLSIDYAAVRAREYNYLIQLRDSAEWLNETGYLLNIHYSAALAEYMLEKEQKKSHEISSESLSQAIQQFPWLIAPLFYELKLTFPTDFPPTVPPSPLQALYTDLYIHRSKDLWTPPELSSWLTTVAKQSASKITEQEPTQTISKIPMNVARHVFVMNVPGLMGHIPREYTARTQLASDPLPPEGSISPYDVPMGRMGNFARDEGAMNRWIEGLVRGGVREGQEMEQEGDVVEENLEEDNLEEDEVDDTFVAQLTNAFRNVVGWFGSSRVDPEMQEEEEDAIGDGHGVD